MATSNKAASKSILKGKPLSQDSTLGELNLASFIIQVTERFGDNEALCWRTSNNQVYRWSYRQMYLECQQVAKSMIAAGVTKDSRVGVLISNRPEWIFVAFGVVMAGGVVVAMNTFSTESELKHQLATADVSLLILEREVASNRLLNSILNICPMIASEGKGAYFNPQLPFLRRVVCVDDVDSSSGIESWESFLQLGNEVPDSLVEAIIESISSVDNAIVFFSSGSTAQPKAIMHTQRAAAAQCWRYASWYNTHGNLRTWSANGFFWSGNFGMALGSTLPVGGCLVLQKYFSPDEALSLLQTERVSLAIAWPHQEIRLTECAQWSQADLSSLIYVDRNGVLAKHPSISTQWQQPNGYGMTETFTFIAGAAGADITDGSYGPVLAGNTIKIVDPDSGETLPIGEVGEIVVKGPTLTPGYLKQAPEDIFDAEGFLHTNDAGYLSSIGTLFWKGRLGDIIKTGGANVSPVEIDSILLQHPAVSKAFTVGLPDSQLGELVATAIVLKEGQTATAEDICLFAKNHLASYKIPRLVQFFLAEDLPMTGSNKIRRQELKQLLNKA